MEKREKETVLFIKTGYTEVLDRESCSRKVSLGDVLRTTTLLHLFKNDEVTWLSDKEAFPLLEGNPYISRLLNLDFENAMHLLDEEDFDVVINLEKNHDICKFSNKINAWRKYGFRYDHKSKSVQAYERALEILAVGFDKEAKRINTRPLQEFLFEMVGAKWNGEEYILGYRPQTSEIFDVGLNTQIGLKWPTKAWPQKYWDLLEDKLKSERFNVSRQDKQNNDILTNLYKYIDWLNSCRTIITNDSLGMHLGLALKKRVITLFGASPHKEVYFYNRGEAVLPTQIPECLPCFKEKCIKNKNCMEDLLPEKVYEVFLKYV